MSSVKGGSIVKKRINGGLFNPHIIRLFFALLLATSADSKNLTNDDAKFDVNYKISWGESRITLSGGGREAQLLMDKSSGAGFESKLLFSSGYFSASIKIPNKNSNGVVTSFYLSSLLDGQPGGNHDELDFEFLGGSGPNYTLQTNIFSLDAGGREQRINLWFDPTQSFHTYTILWNQHQVVFFVDYIPIRVFKNNTSSGVAFPTKEMQVRASIWNGESWAGKGKKIDWSQSPFLARYRGLGLQACQFQNPRERCYSEDMWWNRPAFWYLDDKMEELYQNVRIKYLIYDYCWKGSEKHKECFNQVLRK